MSYEMIDRFLRNNLDDEDYAEYSAALDSICAPSAPDVVKQLVEALESLLNDVGRANSMLGAVKARAALAAAKEAGL